MSKTPAPARLRRAVRAVILADDDRVLLCRFIFPHPAVPTGATGVWAAPGGGIEPGEPPLAQRATALAIGATFLWRDGQLEAVAPHKRAPRDGRR